MSDLNPTLEGMADRLARMEVYQSIQYAVAETLVATASINEATPRILRTVGINLGWELGIFWMVDTERNCLTFRSSWQSPVVEVRGFVDECKKLTFCSGESLPGRVYASGTPVWFPDFTKQNFVRSESAQKNGIKSSLAFPVFADLECIGVMEFFSKNEKQNVDNDTLDILVNVGYRIGQFFKRRGLEKLVRESDARYRVLVDSALSAVIIADSNGNIIEWNTAAETMFGWKKSEVLGRSLTLIMPERYREAHAAGMERIRKSDHTFGSRVIGKLNDLYGLHRDGSEFPLTLSLSTWDTTGDRFFGAIIQERGEDIP